MANRINLGSINLGPPDVGDVTNRPKFFAEYLPPAAPVPGTTCALPSAATFELTNTPLVPLTPSCAFQFPDVIPLPPVFNPLSVKFTACESLTATTNISTCSTTRNTNLVLRASGPTADGSGTPAECALVLEGNICADACATFTGDVNVSFSKAAKNNNSFLAITSAGTPNCGFNLFGNIEVDACPSVGITSDVSFQAAASGSFLQITPVSSAPNCGVQLTGLIAVDACESFTSRTIGGISGAGVKGALRLVAASLPDCGVDLVGDVQIQACVDFRAASRVSLLGAAIREGSSLSLQPESFPNCGVTLVGDITVDACTDFEVNGEITITGKAVSPNSTPITLTANKAPGCGLNLSGNIEINACETVTVTQGPIDGGQQGEIIFTDDSGEVIGGVLLAPQIRVDVSDSCNPKITVDMPNQTVRMATSSFKVKPEDKRELKSGCAYNLATDGLSLYHNKESNLLELSGSIPDICYTCVAAEDTTYQRSSLELSYMTVDNISATQCCPGGSAVGNTLNLCEGMLYFADAAGNDVTINAPPAGSATWQQVTVCIDGVTKVAWVLMAIPA